jgi:hypothetical protein
LDEEFDDWLPAVADETARLAAETRPRRAAPSALLLWSVMKESPASQFDNFEPLHSVPRP